MDIDFGKELKRLREEKGWSQNQLMVKSGVSQASISRIEKGLQDKVIDRTQKALFEAFNQDEEDISIKKEYSTFNDKEKRIIKAISTLSYKDQSEILSIIMDKMADSLSSSSSSS